MLVYWIFIFIDAYFKFKKCSRIKGVQSSPLDREALDIKPFKKFKVN